MESHASHRMKVIVLCYKKGRRPISDTEENIIRENLIRGYNKNDDNFPGALCDGCHLNISAKKKPLNLNMPENYDPQ